MPQCKDCQYQLGRTGEMINVEHMTLPDPPKAICPGDFLSSDQATTPGVTYVSRIEDIAWNNDLATTLADAVAAFVGVAAGEIEDDTVCMAGQEDSVPYVRKSPGSLWRRSYIQTNAAGSDTAATFQQGDLFTFSKSPTANALLPFRITPTADPALAVFKAVGDSGSDVQSRVMVEFV